MRLPSSMNFSTFNFNLSFKLNVGTAFFKKLLQEKTKEFPPDILHIAHTRICISQGNKYLDIK